MDPMRIFITLIISMICFWGSAQSAYACYGYHRLSKMDVAFADIVFNGKIKDIKGDVFTFEVVNVERGKLSTKNIDVEAPRYSEIRAADTVQEFNSRHGVFVRVGVTTPTLANKFCAANAKSGDKVNWSCSKYSLGTAQNQHMPTILVKSCGRPYIVPVDIYEKSQKYAQTYKRFEDRLIKERPDEGRAVELYDKIVGDVSPLVPDSKRHERYRGWLMRDKERLKSDLERGWRNEELIKSRYTRSVLSTYNNAVGIYTPFVGATNWRQEPENMAVELFRRNIDWFTENGEDIASDKALLMFLGMKFVEPNEIERSIAGFDIYQFRGYVIRPSDYDIKYVAKSVRRLKRIIEIDPSYADRLLEVDREPSFWSKIRHWWPW